MIEAITEDPMRFKSKVIVIRYQGPKGGPGMPEMLTPASAIMGAGLGKECGLLTDGKFSGGSHGFVVGHICPEAQKRRIDAQLTDEEMQDPRKNWSPPPYKANRGILFKYIKNVKSASNGCVTDE